MTKIQKTTELVDVDLIKLDKNYEQLVKDDTNPDFLNRAIKKFGHYDNPVAYKKEGKCHLLSHAGSLNGVIKLKNKEILLDIIEEPDIIQFLSSFQYEWHKKPKCMAALLKMVLEYITTPSGKIWFDSICDSKDKEVRLTVLFGVSVHVVKCYLKLIQRGNERFLEKLAKGGSYSLTMAYNECRGTAKGQNAASKTKPRAESDKTTATNEEDPVSGIMKNGIPVAFTQPASRNGYSPVISNGDFEVTDEDKNENNEVEDVDPILERFKKQAASQQAQNHANQQYVKEVFMILNDGSTLYFKDKIMLSIDGKSINSKELFEQMPEGHWCLQAQYDACSINVNFEDSFFSDF